MVAALRDVVRCSAEISGLKSGDTVMDIGCNDGTLLSLYPEMGHHVRRIGVDPSRNLADKAKANCDLFLNEYFSRNPGADRCQLITAIAMFYDLEDVSEFMESVKSWLDRKGVLVIQMTDLCSMICQNAFDNIVHEHLEYWSLDAMIQVMQRFGMVVFRVETNDTNGGSLRAYCSNRGEREIDSTVEFYLKKERHIIKDGLPEFYHTMMQTLAALRAFLLTAHQDGKKVCGIGASTKGNTLLQLLEANSSLISSIGEVSKEKFGYYTIGSSIPIRSEVEVLAENPDYLLILPWHFAGGFKKKLIGRNLVIPMPVPTLNGAALC